MKFFRSFLLFKPFKLYFLWLASTTWTRSWNLSSLHVMCVLIQVAKPRARSQESFSRERFRADFFTAAYSGWRYHSSDCRNCVGISSKSKRSVDCSPTKSASREVGLRTRLVNFRISISPEGSSLILAAKTDLVLPGRFSSNRDSGMSSSTRYYCTMCVSSGQLK